MKTSNLDSHAVDPSRVRTVKIHSTDKKGAGVGETNTGGSLSVPCTIPGETVEVEKIRKHSHLLSIVEPSPSRIEPTCGHFGLCGGCAWQHIDYAKQLELKTLSVAGRLREFSIPFDPSAVKIESGEPFQYRNRMDFVWWFDGRFGLRERGKWHSIVDLNECHLLPDWAMEAALELSRRAQLAGLPFRDQKNKTPGLRYLVIRAGIFTQELMLCIVSDPMELSPDLWHGLERVSSVYQMVNGNAENDNSDGDPVLLDGSPTYRERILGHEFDIGPKCFFQPNPAMAERMAKSVQGWIDASGLPRQKLVDLYCGVGVFAVCLADRFQFVTGIESSAEAIQLAKRNRKKTRIQFQCADANHVHLYNVGDADVLLVDPPREGLMPTVIQQLLFAKPKALIYVSCNPRKGVEDISHLLPRYRIDSIQLFDPFPQTPHVEMIAFLVRK